MTKENRFQDIYEELELQEGSIFRGIDTDEWAIYAQYLNSVLRANSIDKQELEQATEKYNEIEKYLNNSFSRYNFSFYPQGSLAHQTTVRNGSSNRFDLDLICRLNQSTVTPAPLELLQTIYEQLSKDDQYKVGIELKNRCVKLPLPGASFTIDITPGQSINVPSPERVQETDPLVVGDQRLGSKPSNPKGFTSWLNEKAALTPPQVLLLREQLQMKAADSAEPIPDQEVALADVLRRTIQLLKLHRDTYYRKQQNQQRKDYKPISILLSTLATRSYVDRYNQANLTPIELMLDVIDNLHQYIDRDHEGYHVYNPTIQGEDFADKWNDATKGRARATEFFRWHTQVGKDLTDLLTSKDPTVLRDAAQRAFGNQGTELVSGLIASLGLVSKDTFGGNQLLGKLNPSDPQVTHNAPRNTNHA